MKPDGSIYVMIKVPGPSPHASHKQAGWYRENHWVPKARWVWEQANGPVPKGRVIAHLDGDPRNCELGNLACITREALLALNHRTAPKFAGAELEPARIRRAELVAALHEKKGVPA